MRVGKIIITGLVGILVGCASPGPHPDEAYLVGTRTLPPEPIYNRVAMVRPPDNLPQRDIAVSEDAPRVLPVIHLEMKNASLESVAQTLAGSARYRSYTAAAIANQKVSIDALGTIDELADTIGRKANIYISVDHANREVRFLPNRINTPRLYGNDVAQSNN